MNTKVRRSKCCVKATCSSLGVNDGAAYHPDPECVECVKDLIRFLRRDDANHEIRRSDYKSY